MNISYDGFNYEDLPEDFTNEDVYTFRVKSCPNLCKNMDNTPFNSRRTPKTSKEQDAFMSREKPKNSL